MVKSQTIQEASFQESFKKTNKTKGLPLEYRKMITNLKMKKSRQTCTICLENFVEGKIFIYIIG